MAKNPYSQLRDIVLQMEDDFEKFYEKNNKAAGTRVRKHMQDLKELSQKIRLEVQEIKNEE
jgi:hypothetical protein